MFGINWSSHTQREAEAEEAEAEENAEGRRKRTSNAEVEKIAAGSAGGTEHVEMLTPANEGCRESRDGLPFFSPP